LTIIIDDAGSGDLLWGVVIGAYRPEDDVFTYDLIPVEDFQEPRYADKPHFVEASMIALRLAAKLQLRENEKIQICQGNILDEAAKALNERYGEERVERVKVEDRAQHLVEEAYLDEVRNLGYEPLPERTEKWGRSFRHMLEWVRQKPERVKWTKSAFPNLQKMHLFQKGGHPQEGARRPRPPRRPEAKTAQAKPQKSGGHPAPQRKLSPMIDIPKKGAGEANPPRRKPSPVTEIPKKEAGAPKPPRRSRGPRPARGTPGTPTP